MQSHYQPVVVVHGAYMAALTNSPPPDSRAFCECKHRQRFRGVAAQRQQLVFVIRCKNRQSQCIACKVSNRNVCKESNYNVALGEENKANRSEAEIVARVYSRTQWHILV
jgi:hypothetical protein